MKQNRGTKRRKAARTNTLNATELNAVKDYDAKLHASHREMTLECACVCVCMCNKLKSHTIIICRMECVKIKTMRNTATQRYACKRIQVRVAAIKPWY